MPSRQPGGSLPSREFPTDLPARHPNQDLPARHPNPEQPVRRPGPGDQPENLPGRQAMPSRQSAVRPPRPAGRHRRAVPASLPQSAPALVLAVPGGDTDLTSGPVGELAAILRVDNPAVDVRAARIDGGGRSDPTDVRAILADAAARRPAGALCAVVVPLIATPNPPLTRRLREAVAASEANALVSGFMNSNALIAEVLHIRLSEAGLARADRVRLFSIVTAADGILIATVGGPDAAAAANVTSVLLAARLALPVMSVSLDSQPSLQEGAMRLKEMGVNRLAIAPCFIGPEATKSDLDAMAVGAEYAAPLGAHGNIAKLAAMTYGQAISQLEIPGEQL
ncbi:MAG TPA: hypothetical protein VNV62_06075 [Trebonia sp.]|nr:hypothetical protein [Trebonia sp.]